LLRIIWRIWIKGHSYDAERATRMGALDAPRRVPLD
jgi:hypothetical protein